MFSFVILEDYIEPIDRYELSWFGFDNANTLSDHLYEIPYDCLSKSPTKTLPELPLSEPPPKPKRSSPKADAFYVNSDEVEKLLNEVYGDSAMKDFIKPEVKHRALNKIAQERLDIKGEIDQSSAVLNMQRIKSSGDRSPDSHCIPIVRRPEIKKRTPESLRTNMKTPESIGNIAKRESVEDAAPMQDIAEESSHSSVNKLRRGKVPMLPLKNSLQRELSDDIESKQSSNVSPTGDNAMSPTGNNVKDLASMLQSKVKVAQSGRPQIPPRPIHSP